MNGWYIARCRERTARMAVLNGHGLVFPAAWCRIDDRHATFFVDGKRVWRCNANYAPANFDLTPIPGEME